MMSKDLSASTTKSQLDCPVIPDEVFEHHIWKHFPFNKWVGVFSLVCKKWKMICELSRADPKQIFLQINYPHDDVAEMIEVVQKYQPTILRIKVLWNVEDKFLVHRMCYASKRLHTLVLECQDDNDFGMFYKPITHITTLALAVKATKKFWDDLENKFPNVSRLQVEHPISQFIATVDHVTYIHKAEHHPAPKYLAPPDLLIDQFQKVIATKLEDNQPPHSRGLNYEEYFRYFGETRLLVALKNKKFIDASDLLESETSMEYEKALYDANTHYEYPSSATVGFFNPKAYWSNFIDCEWAYNFFVPTNKIHVPNSQKFIALSKFGRIKEALLEFRKLDDKSLADPLVTEAFFDKFLPMISENKLNMKGVYERAKKIVQSATIKNIREDEFRFISDLRDDWSDHFAITEDIDLCFHMIATGCKISIEDFGNLINVGADVTEIVDLVAKEHPSKLFDVLVYYPFKNLKNIVKQYNIELTIERDGESLLNRRIRSLSASKEEIEEYKRLVNHMDSNGNTPLLVAIELPSDRVWPMVHTLLDLGADPTKHRGDKLSPIGMLLYRCMGYKYMHEITNIINLLVEYGVDLNAPCLYEERMCSPLMIAVLNFVSDEIVRLLIVLGARTDYIDETGRTIRDCATSTDRYPFLERYYRK